VDEEESTISLSLVDGLSCGLAALILLFILLALSIGLQRGTLLSGASDPVNAISARPFGSGSVDLVVMFDRAGAGQVASARWTTPKPTEDGEIGPLPESGGHASVSMGYFRRLPRGLSLDRRGRTQLGQTGFEVGLRPGASTPLKAYLMLLGTAGNVAFSLTCDVTQPHGLIRLVGRINVPMIPGQEMKIEALSLESDCQFAPM
jgi:hypothetical protein